jgi:hypothetical protein
MHCKLYRSIGISAIGENTTRSPETSGVRCRNAAEIKVPLVLEFDRHMGGYNDS